MDLSKILNILYRYWWLLALAALVAGLITFFQVSSQPVVYRTSTDLLVGPSLDSPSPDLNALKIGGQLVQTYAQLLDTDPFLKSVNNKLERKMDLDVLRSALTNRQNTDTRVLTINARAGDEKQAIAIANAAAQTLVEMSPSKENTTALLRTQISDQSHQLEQIISESQANIEQLQTELTTLKDVKPTSPDAVKANQDQQTLVMKQLVDERNRLSDALRTLATVYQVMLDTNTNQIEIIEPALTAARVDQQILLRVLSSAISGLILAIIIIFVAEYFDDRLRFPGDLSRAAGVPLLTTIAKHNHIAGSGLDQLVTIGQPASDASNRYREVVAKLLFSIGESLPYTLMLSSVGAQSGDDTAVVTGNLAVAFAEAGYKVTLVDAEIDNPVLTTIFKGDKKEGLADLVISKSAAPELLPVEQVSELRFLPAGTSSEKSSHAMLNSAKLTRLFEGLQKEADIILVASSALSQFAESLALATQVDAVILVARQAEARSKVVNKVVESLRLMKINVAGVIFDYNTSAFGSNEDRKVASAIGRMASKAGQLIGRKSSLSEQTTKS